MNPQKRQQLLVIVAGCLIGLFTVDRLVIGPLTGFWHRRAETIAQLHKDIDRGETIIKREAITRRIWNDMRKNTLPANASQSEKALLEAFYQWSGDSRITVSSIKPQWKRGASDDYSLLDCRIDAAGELGSLIKFLYDVEHTQTALRIESVELTARDNEGRQLALGLTVSGLRLAPLTEE
jgi:hypothetical protein